MPSAAPVPGAAAPASQRRRDPWIDNAKAVLVVLVVVGHFIPLLPRNDAAGHVYDFLYLWHMPAFVLVLSTVMGWVRVDVSHDVSDLEALQPWWIDPSWPFWYLLAMVVWRLATPVLRTHWIWLPLSVGGEPGGGAVGAPVARPQPDPRIPALLRARAAPAPLVRGGVAAPGRGARRAGGDGGPVVAGR